MSDYSRIYNFTAKDALTTGDPNKKIKGTEIDDELNALSTAVNTKYDSTDLDVADGLPQLNSAGTYKSSLLPSEWSSEITMSNDVAVQGKIVAGTPKNILKVSSADIVEVGDNGYPTRIKSSSIPTWTDGLGAVNLVDEERSITAGTGLTGGGTFAANRSLTLANTAATPGSFGSTSQAPVITVDAQGRITSSAEATIDLTLLAGYVIDQNVAHSGVSITAGTGLTGGGTIQTTRTLNLDLAGVPTDTFIGNTGHIVYTDALDQQKRILMPTFATDITSYISHNGLANWDANEHIDHSAVSITAGTGLTGGGTIGATRTINLDISGLTNIDITALGQNDSVLVNDGGNMRQMDREDMGIPLVALATAQTFAAADLCTSQILTGTTARTFTVGTGLGVDGSWIMVGSRDTAILTIAGSGVTITSPLGATNVSAGGLALLYRVSSTEWMLSGALE